MTYNEAVEVLKENQLEHYHIDIDEYKEIDITVRNMAIEALEKQIPREPCCISEMDENDNAMVECPVCHANNDYAINTIKSGYCWKCGQKMNW